MNFHSLRCKIKLIGLFEQRLGLAAEYWWIIQVSGVDVFQTIHQEINEDVIGVLMSGDAGSMSDIQDKKYGFRSYLKKPFAPVELLSTIDETISGKNMNCIC